MSRMDGRLDVVTHRHSRTKFERLGLSAEVSPSGMHNDPKDLSMWLMLHSIMFSGRRCKGVVGFSTRLSHCHAMVTLN